jgi:hypothetical protein
MLNDILSPEFQVGKSKQIPHTFRLHASIDDVNESIFGYFIFVSCETLTSKICVSEAKSRGSAMKVSSQ